MMRDKLAVPLGCRKIMYIRHCTFDRSIIRVFSSSVKRSAGHVYDISVIRCKDEKNPWLMANLKFDFTLSFQHIFTQNLP